MIHLVMNGDARRPERHAMTDDEQRARGLIDYVCEAMRMRAYPLESVMEFIKTIRSEHAADLERAMHVVRAAVKQCEWDRRIGTDELRDTLIAQGFITGERR